MAEILTDENIENGEEKVLSPEKAVQQENDALESRKKEITRITSMGDKKRKTTGGGKGNWIKHQLRGVAAAAASQEIADEYAETQERLLNTVEEGSRSVMAHVRKMFAAGVRPEKVMQKVRKSEIDFYRFPDGTKLTSTLHINWYGKFRRGEVT